MNISKIVNSGVLIGVVGIVLFSAKAIMVKLSYQYEVSSIHLLLHGHRGIGKNTLIYILENLVGPSNYYYVPKDFFDNNFNSELRHRRLLYFDEHKINSKVNEAEFKQSQEPTKEEHGKGRP